MSEKIKQSLKREEGQIEFLIFRVEIGENMLVTKKLSNDNTWININSDEITKHSKVYEEYDIDPKTLEYALDENEHAHMDYDREDGTVTFIYSVLDLEKDKEYYETVPLTFIVQKNRLVTISNEDNVYIIQKMCDYVDGKENLSIYTLLFATLEMISNAYYPIIERLDKQKDEINYLLRQKTTKKNLYALSDLEHIQAHAIYRSFNEEESAHFDDAMVEARQLVSMTDLLSTVARQLLDSYNNVLNNDLNNNLSTLTIFEILLSVLAVITGFFGMNVPLPFMNEQRAWIMICIVSALVWVILTWVMRWIIRRR